MILDTNGLSALAEGETALEPLLRKAAQVAIPVIVLGEYRYGVSQSRNHIHYEQWLAEYLPSFFVSPQVLLKDGFCLARVQTFSGISSAALPF